MTDGTKRATWVPAALVDDPDFLRELVERTLQTLLDEEMTAHRPEGTRRRALRTHG